MSHARDLKVAFSFSLTGDSRRYTQGLKANFQAVKAWSPDCSLILHHDATADVRDADGWIRQIWEADQSLECHFWRFAAAGDRQYDAVFVRDLDAVVTDRELRAVEQFLESPYRGHAMRDHWWHTKSGGCPYPVMGGMWGVKTTIWPAWLDFEHLVRWWIKHKRPFQRWSDCWFLNRFVFPRIRADGIEHDGGGTHWGGVAFPTDRVGSEFVGETMFSD